MSLASKFAHSTAAFVLAFGFAANANAGGLQPGKCYSKDQAEAVLKQEGQFPIFIGNRITDSRNVNIFFLNRDGYGYNLEGDRPKGMPSNKICVAAAYKDARLNDPDNPEIPSWGKNIKTTGNGIDVQKAYKNGGRFLMVAQTYENRPDGTERLGKGIVVIAGPQESGDVWSVDSKWLPDSSFSMVNLSITPKMQELLSQGKRAALSAPPTLALVKP